MMGKDLGFVNVHIVQQQLEVCSFVDADIPSSANHLDHKRITSKPEQHNAIISVYQALLQRHGVKWQ